VKRQYVFVFLQSHGRTYSNGFLTYARKPFTDAVLPQEYQHFFFNEAWLENGFV
jgi:hypothetical protein